MNLSSRRSGAWVWAALAAFVLLYAPMAVEYMWGFFGVSHPQLWLRTYSAVVGEGQAVGVGSIARQQQAAYAGSRWSLLFHTTTGGLALLIGLAQLNRRLRTRRPVLHRRLGRVQVGLVVVAMAGSMAYLVRTGPDATFDGPAFYMQLWFLAVGTLGSSIAAVVAIRRRQVAMHQALMAYNYALLLTAPLLRLEYLLLGMGRATTQEVTNIQGGLVLGFAAPTAAVAASRYFDNRRVVDGAALVLPGPRLDRVGGVVCAVGALAVGAGYVRLVGAVDRLVPALVVSFAVFLTVAVVTEQRARRAGRSLAAYDWRIHRLALQLSPVALVALWWVYSGPFETTAAFYAAALTAPPLMITVGLLLAIWARRRLSPVAGPRDHVDAVAAAH